MDADAARYANETLIAAYDVINEPVLTDGATNKDMRAFYLRLTDSIRTVDQNHLLFFEGNWYATNFDDLPPRWDDNMGFAFHRYWGPTHLYRYSKYVQPEYRSTNPHLARRNG
jgi:endoglucanase